MMIFSSYLASSSPLKTFHETCLLLPLFGKRKLALCKITLEAKSCGVPFVLSLASLFFYTDAGTPDADGFYLDVDE